MPSQQHLSLCWPKLWTQLPSHTDIKCHTLGPTSQAPPQTSKSPCLEADPSSIRNNSPLVALNHTPAVVSKPQGSHPPVCAPPVWSMASVQTCKMGSSFPVPSLGASLLPIETQLTWVAHKVITSILPHTCSRSSRTFSSNMDLTCSKVY